MHLIIRADKDSCLACWPLYYSIFLLWEISIIHISILQPPFTVASNSLEAIDTINILLHTLILKLLDHREHMEIQMEVLAVQRRGRDRGEERRMQVKNGQKTEEKWRAEYIVPNCPDRLHCTKPRAGSQVVMRASSGDKARRVERLRAPQCLSKHTVT